MFEHVIVTPSTEQVPLQNSGASASEAPPTGALRPTPTMMLRLRASVCERDRLQPVGRETTGTKGVLQPQVTSACGVARRTPLLLQFEHCRPPLLGIVAHAPCRLEHEGLLGERKSCCSRRVQGLPVSGHLGRVSSLGRTQRTLVAIVSDRRLTGRILCMHRNKLPLPV